MNETCGAVTGAFMALGLKYGRFIADDLEAKAKTNGLVQEFAKEFKELNGSIRCTELLKCNLSTPEGVQSANEQNVFKTICPKLVKDAARIVERLLIKEGV
jgi:C_GCAxxG_C_C family probable redox protein